MGGGGLGGGRGLGGGGGLGGRFPWPFKHSLQSILFHNQGKGKNKVSKLLEG